MWTNFFGSIVQGTMLMKTGLTLSSIVVVLTPFMTVFIPLPVFFFRPNSGIATPTNWPIIPSISFGKRFFFDWWRVCAGEASRCSRRHGNGTAG